MTEVTSRESTTEDVAAAGAAAAAAATAVEALGRSGRASLLRALAGALEADQRGIIELADRETALGEQRLGPEFVRTCFQIRAFADLLDEGSYLEATIDHAGPTDMGPRPDLRRMLVPLGPVAVFGASNFPLAFSVPGGDTVSALAAGCPVIVKAHPSHPETSARCFTVLAEAARAAGAPEGTLGIVSGQRAGLDLVTHPAVRAVAFTGSYRGGRALFDAAVSRPDPIPFYGELDSINPLVVTPGAAEERAVEIAEGFVQSITAGSGQLCTRPGIAFVPAGEAGARMRSAVAERVRSVPAMTLLNSAIHDSFGQAGRRLRAAAGVRVVAEAETEGRMSASALVLATTADRIDEVAEQVFGPFAVLVEYTDEQDLLTALDRLPGSLATTVHNGANEEGLTTRLADLLRTRSGRLVWNGFPTGLAVTPAMHHGGPFPSTTDPLHTSVGSTAIRRFLRPFCWQNAPRSVLPVELRDADPGIPRRIDGRLVV